MEHPDDTGVGTPELTSTATVSELTALANRHLKSNDIDNAFPIVCTLAEHPEASASTITTAGVLALSLSDKERARHFFEQALGRDTNHFDAGYNLALMDLEEGKVDSAGERLSSLLQINPNNAALYNDMAVVRLRKDDLEGAIQYWQEALTVNPNYSLARDNAMEILVDRKMIPEGKHLLLLNAKAPGVSSTSIKEIERWAHNLGEAVSPVEMVSQCTNIKGKKIAVFSGIDSFMKDINRHLSTDNELKIFTGGTVEQMRQMMEWADLAWFEWCDNLIIEATRLPKLCKIVCRLHSYEAFTDMPSRVDWSKVDRLIFVSDAVRELVDAQLTTPVPSVVIKNAVDGQRFELPSTKQYGKKIASVGYINYKKNPGLLLYCFKKIHEYDPEYTLHIAGEHQDPRIKLYFSHFLKENPLPVHFDGWVENMPEWYADKDFVISTSLFESFHYSIAEGMASGLMPLIHNWYGARTIYPEQYMFDDPDGCLDLLKQLEQQDRSALAMENRRFILENYELSQTLKTISENLGSLFEIGAEAQELASEDTA